MAVVAQLIVFYIFCIYFLLYIFLPVCLFLLYFLQQRGLRTVLESAILPMTAL